MIRRMTVKEFYEHAAKEHPELVSGNRLKRALIYLWTTYSTDSGFDTSRMSTVVDGLNEAAESENVFCELALRAPNMGPKTYVVVKFLIDEYKLRR